MTKPRTKREKQSSKHATKTEAKRPKNQEDYDVIVYYFTIPLYLQVFRPQSAGMDLWSSTNREDAEYGIVPTSDEHEGHGREDDLAETKGAARSPALVTKNRQNMLLAIFIAAACK